MGGINNKRWCLFFSKYKIVIGISVFLILLLGLRLYGNTKKNQFYKKEYSGIVSEIEYNVKGFPTFLVNGVEGSCSCNNYGGDPIIEVGDSIVKNKNSFDVELYKKGEYVHTFN
ncbi:MAG: hypothetical protein V4622_02055 [Bacteroidota bacterium]